MLRTGLSLDELVAPWLDGGAPARALVLDPRDPAHRGLDALLAVREREGSPPIPRSWSGDGLRMARAEALPAGDLPDRPVVLASGGTTGILARCLAALPGARGLVFGRREQGHPPEGFAYRRCDVTDPDDVRAAASDCRARFGRLDVVIHAAGALRDGPLASRTPDDVRAVFGPKLDGARHLIAATLDDRPAVWAAFGSVSAGLANPGQALYAAANAALEAMEHPTAGRSLTLAWSAWSEVGMASDPALLRLLRARGIRALTPDEGASRFVDALRGAGVRWLAHEPPPGDPLPWPLTGADGAGTFRVGLDPDAPALADHRLGRPLVPAALWVAALRRAGEILAWRAGSPAPDVLDLDVLAPTFVARPTEVRLRVQPDGTAEITRDGAVVCVARLGRATPAERGESPPMAGGRPVRYAPDGLFHGPSWRVLARYGVDGERAWAELSPGPLDPLASAVDGAHQLLALWAAERGGARVLPVGAGSWALGEGRLHGPLRAVLHGRSFDGGVEADLALFDADGRAAVVGRSVRARDAGPWSRDA